MRNRGTRQAIGWMAAFLLVFSGAGCGTCWMPSFLCVSQSATPAAPVNEPGPPRLPPQLGQAIGSPHATEGIAAASYETSSQALAMMSQKVAAIDDDRKVLTARLQQMEGLLEARDQALAAAARELEAARVDIAATRSEMERWKEKMQTQQEELRSTERKNMGTLQSIIKLLEQTMEEGKEGSPAKPALGQPDGRPAEQGEGR